MRRIFTRVPIVLACVVVALIGAGTAAGASSAELSAEMGISFIPESDASQCNGARQQWAPSPNWTSSIQLDTDQRTGGCLLAFGVRDLTGALAGLNLSYTWGVMPDSNGTQCGNQGVYNMPVTQFPAVGPSILVDTDQRRGGCFLTFSMSGRNDVALDVQFWADGDGSQCLFTVPQGQWRTVLPGAPVTVGIDTDQRFGGCNLALRLRQF